jgi:streptogramin lyase
MNNPPKKASGASRAGLLAVSIGLVFGGAAHAQVISEFSTNLTASSQPHGITAGPDGNLWFAEFTAGKIGRITPAGVITEFSIPSGALPWDIAAGPDGNLWFTEQFGGKIGRITPAGVITEFGAGITQPVTILGIAAGPDGNMWFTEYQSRIGRITMAGVVSEFTAGLSPNSAPQGITAGPDGNMWFTEYANPGRIGRVTMAGAINEFEIGITPGGGIEAITAGADGNVWFANQNSDLIGKITPAGVVTEYPIPPTIPAHYAQTRGITLGPDGNVWFVEYAGDRVGRITPAGVVTEFNAGLTPFARPRAITTGPDGALWFTEEVGNRIGRITTGVTPPGVSFFGLPPCRVLDTRNAAGALGGPALQPAGSADRAFVVTVSCGIPADATAISTNVTVTNTAAAGFLSIYRGDGARTGTSSISFGAGQTRANNALLQLAFDASGSVKVQNTAAGTLDFILDVNGFFR